MKQEMEKAILEVLDRRGYKGIWKIGIIDEYNILERNKDQIDLEGPLALKLIIRVRKQPLNI